jgi:hypothetical protein
MDPDLLQKEAPLPTQELTIRNQRWTKVIPCTNTLGQLNGPKGARETLLQVNSTLESSSKSEEPARAQDNINIRINPVELTVQNGQ